MRERTECILKQVATPHFWQRIGHHLAPLTLSDWRLATPRWSKFAKLRQQSVCSHFRGAGGRKGREKREGVESRSSSSSSSVWAVIFTLIFSFEKSSTLQGVVTVKCFEFVSCGNCFFPPRLTSAAPEQFEKSEFCSVEDAYALYTWERGISAELRWCVCCSRTEPLSGSRLRENSLDSHRRACRHIKRRRQFNTPVVSEKRLPRTLLVSWNSASCWKLLCFSGWRV